MREAVSCLKKGGIAVIPTDTVHGIVARALDREAVKRLYRIRRKTPNKPFIILISAINDLKKFGVILDAKQKILLKTIWPNKVSVILNCASRKFEYLHLGTNKLAFRLPKKKGLIALIKKVGPLVAPSANPEGLPTAKNIKEVKNYFGALVNCYVVRERADNRPSTILDLTSSVPEIIRQGSVKINVKKLAP